MLRHALSLSTECKTVMRQFLLVQISQHIQCNYVSELLKSVQRSSNPVTVRQNIDRSYPGLP